MFSNKLTGALPLSLAKCGKMKNLHLNSNSFTLSTLLLQSDSLGTPETNFRGLSTLIARSVRRSTSPLSGVTRVINLEEKML